MTIDLDTGLITWTPAAGDVGDHDVIVRVGDGRGGFDSQTYTLTVTNDAPVEIRGTKYYDRNGNGVRDGDLDFLLVSSSNTNNVLRYDAATGAVRRGVRRRRQRRPCRPARPDLRPRRQPLRGQLRQQQRAPL